MQVAHILSDLTSLLVCDNRPAALELIAARPRSVEKHDPSNVQRQKTQGVESSAQSPSNPDLDRAYKLQKLHTDVKEAYKDNVGEASGSKALAELRDARVHVRRALASLEPDETIIQDHGGRYAAGETTLDIEEEDDISAWAG